MQPAKAPPTKQPTKSPSKASTKQPTKSPSKAPTKQPTKAPTRVPTNAPVRTFWSLSSNNVQDLVLFITYSWSVSSQTADLDGGLFFLGIGGGYGNWPKNDPYMSYTRDGRGATDSEEFNVKLGRAFADGKWSGSTTVLLRASWFGRDHGQANATLSTKRVLPNGTTINDNNAISFVIDPALGDTTVANATVSIGVGGTVTITGP
jgi:PT repeat